MKKTYFEKLKIGDKFNDTNGNLLMKIGSSLQGGVSVGGPMPDDRCKVNAVILKGEISKIGAGQVVTCAHDEYVELLASTPPQAPKEESKTTADLLNLKSSGFVHAPGLVEIYRNALLVGNKRGIDLFEAFYGKNNKVREAIRSGKYESKGDTVVVHLCGRDHNSL